MVTYTNLFTYALVIFAILTFAFNNTNKRK